MSRIVAIAVACAAVLGAGVAVLLNQGHGDASPVVPRPTSSSAPAKSLDSPNITDVGPETNPPAPRSTPVPPPSQLPPADPGVIIEPGVPPQYLSSYLNGRSPSEIHADGTQIFKNVPFYVRQPDGTMVPQNSTITIKPAAILPIDPEATPAPDKPDKPDGPDKQH